MHCGSATSTNLQTCTAADMHLASTVLEPLPCLKWKINNLKLYCQYIYKYVKRRIKGIVIPTVKRNGKSGQGWTAECLLCISLQNEGWEGSCSKLLSHTTGLICVVTKIHYQAVSLSRSINISWSKKVVFDYPGCFFEAVISMVNRRHLISCYTCYWREASNGEGAGWCIHYPRQ